jgi:hypothetical protein
VDTPGFDDSHGNDEEIVNGILQWLKKSAASGEKLHGLLYFHRIIDPRVTGTARANVRMFKRLCGNDNLGSVLLVTTFWNEVDRSLGERRERQLRYDEKFWKPMIDKGSSILRSKQNRSEDLMILSKVAERNQKFYMEAQTSMQNGMTSAQVSRACQRAPEGEIVQREREAQEARLAAERASAEALLRQNERKKQETIARERAAQRQRQEEAEKRQRQEREKREREQNRKEAAEQRRKEAEEEELQRLYEQIILQERLEREEEERQRQYAAHVCQNISLKRRSCSRCFLRMDWVGTGLWCYRRSTYNLLPLYWTSRLTAADCCHCDWDQFHLCQGCGPTCGNNQHPVMKIRYIEQTFVTGIFRN